MSRPDPYRDHVAAAVLADVRAARRAAHSGPPWAVLAAVAAAVAVAVATWPWAAR